ncbi:MAG: hypothetical protein WBC22_12705 [Sedimentisphaerales bacterium]
MVYGKRAWIIIILCGLGLTIWQVPNLVYLWRQYQSVTRLPRGGLLELPSAPKPLFPQQVEQTDTEAADVANCLLSSNVTKVDELAALVLKYPQNDLLISRLLYKILSTDGLDPKIADLLADRLLESQPENAYFHYLKAIVQMQTTSPTDFERVLEDIEEGNKSDVFSFPYYTYRNRIFALFEKANLNPAYFVGCLEPFEFQNQMRLATRLNEQAVQAFANRERDYGLRALHAGSVMAQKYFDNSKNLLQLFVSISLCRSIKSTELEYAELAPNQARHVRFHLSSLKTIDDTTREKTLEYKQKTIFALLIGMGMLGGWVAVSIFLLCTPIFITNLIRKTPKDCKVKWSAHVLWIGSILYFLVLITTIALFTIEQVWFIILGYLAKKSLYLPLLCMVVSVFIWLTFWLMDYLKPYRKVSYRFTFIKSCFSITFCIALAAVFIMTLAYDFSWRKAFIVCLFSIGISALLWLILMYGWWSIRKIPYRWLTKNRIIQLLLIITFFSAIFVVLEIEWLKLILGVLLIASISIIIFHPPSEKMPSLVKGWIQFFGKSEQIATTRPKIIKLLSPYLVVFYFCFLISVHFNSDVCRETTTRSLDELAAFGTLPPPNWQTYYKMVDRIMTGKISARDSIQYLHMIEPNDLPYVLSTVKNSDPDGIDDRRLCELIESSTSDTLNIMLDFLDDPNSDNALINRAKAGDETVKANLLLLLKKKRAAFEASESNVERWNDYWDQPRLGHCFRIAGALAYISEPNENLERFLDLVENSDLARMEKGTVCPDSRDFYYSLTGLPTKHATRVLKAYLNKTDYSDLRPVKAFSWLPETLSQFADSDTAEDVFKIMCRTSPMAKPFDTEIKGANHPIVKAIKELLSPSYEASKRLKAIAPYFDMDSINTLKDGLESTDEDLRAYTVGQLTRVGYKWSKKELEGLIQDESWKVRANIALAVSKERATLMQDDQNSLVKLSAKMNLAYRM